MQGCYLGLGANIYHTLKDGLYCCDWDTIWVLSSKESSFVQLFPLWLVVTVSRPEQDQFCIPTVWEYSASQQRMEHWTYREDSFLLKNAEDTFFWSKSLSLPAKLVFIEDMKSCLCVLFGTRCGLFSAVEVSSLRVGSSFLWKLKLISCLHGKKSVSSVLLTPEKKESSW